MMLVCVCVCARVDFYLCFINRLIIIIYRSILLLTPINSYLKEKDWSAHYCQVGSFGYKIPETGKDF